MKHFIIISIFISSIFAVQKEKLFYGVYYNNIKSGNATLEINNHPDSNLSNIIFHLKSKKLIDLIYKLRESTSIAIDKLNYSINEVSKSIRHGRKKKKYTASFNYHNNSGYINNQFIQTPNLIYDPITIIYFLRNEQLFINNTFPFHIISQNKIKSISMKVIGEENISIKKHQYDCMIVAPDNSTNNNKLKNMDEIKIWISKDSISVPVIIEKKAKYGVIKMILENYE